MAVKEDEFRKEIHLPKKFKSALKIQALKEGYTDMKNMIQARTIESLMQHVQDHHETGDD